MQARQNMRLCDAVHVSLFWFSLVFDREELPASLLAHLSNQYDIHSQGGGDVFTKVRLELSNKVYASTGQW